MKTKRNVRNKQSRRRQHTNKRRGAKSGKKWTTAIEAAQQTLNKTGSYQAARESLKKQALTNARKLFGSVGNI